MNKRSNMKSDPRYSSESVFDTFPWPQTPSPKLVVAVATAAKNLRAIRNAALVGVQGGLRVLYKTLDLPGKKNPLRDAHAALDAAVLNAYGFSAKKDLLQQILDLNIAVGARIEAGSMVNAPGIPTGFPKPAALISTDSIGD